MSKEIGKEISRVTRLKPVEAVKASPQYRPPFEDRHQSFRVSILEDGETARLEPEVPLLVPHTEDEGERERAREIWPHFDLKLGPYSKALQAETMRYLSDHNETKALQRALELAKDTSRSSNQIISQFVTLMVATVGALPSLRLAHSLGKDWLVNPEEISTCLRGMIHVDIPVGWRVAGIDVKLVPGLLKRTRSPACLYYDLVCFDERYFDTASKATRDFILGHELGHFVNQDGLASLAGKMVERALERESFDSQIVEGPQSTLLRVEEAGFLLLHEKEFRADLHGYVFAEKRRHPPCKILEGFRQSAGSPKYFNRPDERSTHPNWARRIAAVEEYARGRRA